MDVIRKQVFSLQSMFEGSKDEIPPTLNYEEWKNKSNGKSQEPEYSMFSEEQKERLRNNTRAFNEKLKLKEVK